MAQSCYFITLLPFGNKTFNLTIKSNNPLGLPITVCYLMSDIMLERLSAANTIQNHSANKSDKPSLGPTDHLSFEGGSILSLCALSLQETCVAHISGYQVFGSGMVQE